MRISFDPNGAFALRNINQTNRLLDKSMQRLSSGLRVSRPSDDPAGFSMAIRMRGQISSLEVVQRGVQTSRAMVETTAGGLQASMDILQRVRDIAVQWNSTTDVNDRANMQAEVVQLNAELVRLHTNTTFDGINVLGGATATSATIQVGTAATDTLAISNPQMQTVLGTTISGFSTQSTATAAGTAAIDTVIQNVSNRMATNGALSTRLESIENSNDNYLINLMDAHSKIVDVDMAKEMANKVGLEMRQQIGMATLAQANQNRQMMFNLLFNS